MSIPILIITLSISSYFIWLFIYNQELKKNMKNTLFGILDKIDGMEELDEIQKIKVKEMVYKKFSLIR